MMGRGMMGGQMGGGMMQGPMGSGPWADSGGNCPCPMCGEPYHHGRGRRLLSKEERKEHLKEYLENLEAEFKAVKELLDEEK